MTEAIILAGGLGTRLRSIVPDLPKPMASIHKRPFLEYVLDYWISQGVGRFILSVGYRHDDIQNHFKKEYRGVELVYAVEEFPIGTGGAFLMASKQLSHKDVPFLLLNGDTYFQVSLKELLEISLKANADWCFSLFESQDLTRYLGVDIDPTSKRILSFINRGTSTLFNGGVYLIHPRVIEPIQNALITTIDGAISLENSIFKVAMCLGQNFYGLKSEGIFLDIGIPVDYEKAYKLIPTS